MTQAQEDHYKLITYKLTYMQDLRTRVQDLEKRMHFIKGVMFSANKAVEYNEFQTAAFLHKWAESAIAGTDVEQEQIDKELTAVEHGLRSLNNFPLES